jgi:hypothetical protein
MDVGSVLGPTVLDPKVPGKTKEEKKTKRPKSERPSHTMADTVAVNITFKRGGTNAATKTPPENNDPSCYY